MDDKYVIQSKKLKKGIFMNFCRGNFHTSSGISFDGLEFENWRVT